MAPKRPDEILFISFIILTMFIVLSVQADEMTHKFKSPSFSGQNTSSHYLTIENQEFNRKEALREELLTHRADSRLAGLSVHELGVEVLPQASNVDAGSGSVRHILDVMLSVLDPLGRRKDRVQDVLTRRLSVKRRQLLLLGA